MDRWGPRWLLSERLGPTDFKFYLLNLDADASLVDLVTLARSRWPIEQQYRELKDDLGLDHFEGRTYGVTAKLPMATFELPRQP